MVRALDLYSQYPSSNSTLVLFLSSISIIQLEIEHYYLLVGAKVNEIDIDHHNSTHLTVTVSLAYTGGGTIHTIILQSSREEIRISAVQSSNLVWTGDFSITDTSLNPAERLDFLVSVQNEYGFNSDGHPVVGELINSL